MNTAQLRQIAAQSSPQTAGSFAKPRSEDEKTVSRDKPPVPMSKSAKVFLSSVSVLAVSVGAIAVAFKSHASDDVMLPTLLGSFVGIVAGLTGACVSGIGMLVPSKPVQVDATPTVTATTKSGGFAFWVWIPLATVPYVAWHHGDLLPTLTMESPLDHVEKQVAQDALDQYEMVVKNTDRMGMCVHAGLVSAAFLQAKDESNYRFWKNVEKHNCAAVGINEE